MKILSQQSTKLAILFREQFVIFLEELSEQFPEETDIIIIKIFIKDQIPLITIMDYIIKWLMPCIDKIKQKDENFFLNNDDIFSKLPNSKVLHIKKLWQSGQLTDEDKEIIWNWFDVFGDICVKYKKSLEN